jgi:hypothetical protein
MNNGWQILGVVIAMLLFSYGVANLVFQWKIREYHKKAELMTKKDCAEWRKSCPVGEQTEKNFKEILKRLELLAKVKECLIEIALYSITDNEDLRGKIIGLLTK